MDGYKNIRDWCEAHDEPISQADWDFQEAIAEAEREREEEEEEE